MNYQYNTRRVLTFVITTMKISTKLHHLFLNEQGKKKIQTAVYVIRGMNNSNIVKHFLDRFPLHMFLTR